MRYLDAHSRFMPSQHQPAQVLDFARDRDVSDSVVLRHTELRERDILECPTVLSAKQYLQMMANVAAAVQGADTHFLLGQLALPGHFGALSQALTHAPNLASALDLLVANPLQLSPMLVPHLQVNSDQTILYWTDAFGAPAQRAALVEMSMAALSSMTRWLSEKPIDWTFCFNLKRPRSCEQHEVHLGRRLRFDCLIDGVIIDTAELQRPWPRSSEAGWAVATRTLAQGHQTHAVGLLAGLYEYLLRGIQAPPSLDVTAAHFGMSPATFKRHLSRLGTHFQAELDLVRTHVALHMFRCDQCDNEQVANYLGFHDTTNFRRSFKRWTGVTPLSLKTHFLKLS